MFLDQQDRGGERRHRLPNDPLGQHLITLALDLIFQELKVTIRPHRHWSRAGKQVDAVIMASWWRQALRLLEEIVVFEEQGVHEIARCGEGGHADTRAVDAVPQDSAALVLERHG